MMYFSLTSVLLLFSLLLFIHEKFLLQIPKFQIPFKPIFINEFVLFLLEFDLFLLKIMMHFSLTSVLLLFSLLLFIREKFLLQIPKFQIPFKLIFINEFDFQEVRGLVDALSEREAMKLVNRKKMMKQRPWNLERRKTIIKGSSSDFHFHLSVKNSYHKPNRTKIPDPIRTHLHR